MSQHPTALDAPTVLSDASTDCDAIGLQLASPAMALPGSVVRAICRAARGLFRPEQGMVVHGVGGELLATDVQMRELTGVGWLPGVGAPPPGWVVIGQDGTELSTDRLPRAEVQRTGSAVLGRCLGLQEPAGAVRWVDVCAYPVRTADGELVATITTLKDRDEWGAGTGAAPVRAGAVPGAAIAVCDRLGRIVSLDGAADERYPGARVGDRLAAVARWNLPAERIERLLAEGQAPWSGTLWMPDGMGQMAPVVLRILPAGELTVAILEPGEADPEAGRRTDPLTGLLDRARFLEGLGVAVAARDHDAGSITIAAIELDDLRRVRDAHGHHVAEEAVVSAAAALRRAAHRSDLVARLSDSSFGICCHHLGHRADAQELAERLRTAVADAIGSVGAAGAIACSAGVSSSTGPNDAASDLLQQAELALAERSAPAACRTHRYDADLRSRLARRARAERAVRRATAEGQVRLGYQPIVWLADESVSGAEALLRLVDEDGAPVPPVEAIEAAEEHGLIGELGLLVLEEACREAARWQEQAPHRFFTIAVNLSANQLADPVLFEKVQRTLDQTGLDASRLKLEMTETVLMEDSDRSVAQLERLKLLGIRLAADDFGTGYSSLAYLKRFPLDVVKADRSFVSGLPDSPEDAAVVAAIVGVAGALGLRVVAEGVEDEAQRSALLELGCHHGQGWLWSRDVEGGTFLDRVVEIERGAEARRGGAAPPSRSSRSTGPLARAAADNALHMVAEEVRGPILVLDERLTALEVAGEVGVADLPALRDEVGALVQFLARLDDLEAFDEGAVPLELALFDLDAELVTPMAALSDRLGVPVRLERLHVGASPVVGDRERIVRAVGDLVENAARHGPPEVGVLVVVTRRGRWMEVRVCDEGPGIEPAQVALAFRKYGRAGATSGRAGLGLYLARRVARAHGGEVTYRSRSAPAGSVFALRLPIAAARPPS